MHRLSPRTSLNRFSWEAGRDISDVAENLDVVVTEEKTIWKQHGPNWVFVFCCCSLTQSCLTLQPHGLQHARLPCPSPTPKTCSNSYPSSQWCHPTIWSSVTPFSSCPQSVPASGTFPVSRLFSSGDQRIRASVSASVPPMHIQGWFPLGLTGLISLLSSRLSRVFSGTTVRKHQFFGTQPSLGSSSHICTWLLEKP